MNDITLCGIIADELETSHSERLRDISYSDILVRFTYTFETIRTDVNVSVEVIHNVIEFYAMLYTGSYANYRYMFSIPLINYQGITPALFKLEKELKKYK